MSGPAAPLAKKLGIAAGARLFLHEALANYRELLAPLPAGVQTVVCAVDETWSGLKLVIRRTRRAAPGKLPRTRAAAGRPGSRS
jgi:hypothetical protein